MFGKKQKVEIEKVEMSKKDKIAKYKHELENGFQVDYNGVAKQDSKGNAKKLTQREVAYRQGFLGSNDVEYKMSNSLKKPTRFNKYGSTKNKATK